MAKLFSNYSSPPYTNAYNKVYIIMEIARLIEEKKNNKNNTKPGILNCI